MSGLLHVLEIAADDDALGRVLRLADGLERAGVRVSVLCRDRGDERVDVMHAHGAAAHLVAVLAGALCDVPCVGAVALDEIPMLDLEAHRLGERSHLCVAQEAALHHARTLGVPGARLHRCGVEDAAGVVEVLRTCVRNDEAAAEAARRP